MRFTQRFRAHQAAEEAFEERKRAAREALGLTGDDVKRLLAAQAAEFTTEGKAAMWDADAAYQQMLSARFAEMKRLEAEELAKMRDVNFLERMLEESRLRYAELQAEESELRARLERAEALVTATQADLRTEEDELGKSSGVLARIREDAAGDRRVAEARRKEAQTAASVVAAERCVRVCARVRSSGTL
jgi:chromosome segregation ATPase